MAKLTTKTPRSKKMAEVNITSASDNTSEITSEAQSATVNVAPAEAKVTITAAPVSAAAVDGKAQLQTAIEALEAEVAKLGSETKSFFHVFEVKAKLQTIIAQAKTLF